MLRSYASLFSVHKTGERVEVASRYISCAGSLLDIGCGDGALGYFVRNRVKEAYGIERPGIKLTIPKGIYRKVIKVDLNSRVIPFAENYFDYAACLDVIEHIKEPEALLKDIIRVLKKNGTLILSAPNILYYKHIVRLIFKRRFPVTSNDKNSFDGGHIHYFTSRDLSGFLKSVGFNSISIHGINNNNRKDGLIRAVFSLIVGKVSLIDSLSPGLLLVARK